MKEAAFAAVEAKISTLAGRETEITVLSDRAFTFSFEGKDEVATQRVSNFLRAGGARVSSLYDDECEMTFIYLDA